MRSTRTKLQQRRSDLKRRYGLTLSQYADILKKQGGVCAICLRRPSRRRLAVDHCHRTRAIRGLLCMNCNSGLGKLGDCPEHLRAALRYLETSV